VDDTPPSSLVDTISPYQPQVVPFTITVSGLDNGCLGGCGIREVALSYRYSPDNTSWSTWILYGNNKTQPPYEWLFTAPKGNGYYEFYSRGVDNLGNTEQPPEFCDTRCLIQGCTTPVYIDPPTQTLLGGKSFSVSITIDPAEEIAGAQFNLSFDPLFLMATTVMEGNLFTGFTSSFNSGNIDNANGTINGVSSVITVPGGSTVSSGTLAIIHFTAKTSSGVTPLNLSNVIVGNITGVPLQVSITNGSVDIIVDTAPPQIENIITNPIPQVPGGHVNISVVITDNVEIEEICITLFYPSCIKKERISLKHNHIGDLYYCNQTLDVIGYYSYFIWACDTSGNQVFSNWRTFKILPSV
jgi:hypothetical protein